MTGTSKTPFDIHDIEVSSEPHIVTPALARKWIADAPRPTSSQANQAIELYGRAMGEKRWPMNGDPIVFDRDGKVVSGTLRLWACIDSGEDFATLVVWNVPPEAAITVRSHLQRTNKDALSISGEVYATELAAAWPFVMGFLNGRDKERFNVPRRDKLGFQEIEGLTQRYPEIRESAQYVRDIGAVSKMGSGLTTAIHYLMTLDDRGKANTFINVLVDPTLDPESGAAALSEKLRTEKRASQGYRFGLFVKAWNKFREGRNLSVERLRYVDRVIDGAPREPLPRMEGIPDDARIDIAELPNVLHAQEDARSVVEGSRGLSVRVVWMTREWADDLLTRNGPVGGHGNRKLRETHVASIGRDLVGDDFIFNGQPIKVALSGRLIDGQHRLTACSKTGVGFWTLLVENLDDDVFTTFDTGQRLGLAGALRDAGHKESVTLAAAIALLRKVYGHGWITPTAAEGFAFVEEHPLLAASVENVKRNAAGEYSPRSFLAALDYLAGNVDREVATAFMRSLHTGANLDEGTALLVLREMLRNQKRSNSRPVTERILRQGMVAWNGHRKGTVPFRLVDPNKFPDLI